MILRFAVRRFSTSARKLNSNAEEARSSSNRKGTNVVDVLASRSLLQQTTAPNSLRKHLDEAKRTVYTGVDPSADSLHVGNLLPLLALLHFVRQGHDAIALIGGATGSIGDPSGRDTERSSLSPEVLRHNVSRITEQVHDFFGRANQHLARHRDSDGPEVGKVTVVNNADFYQSMNVLDFLRDVGRYARVGSMLARDSVKNRLQPSEGKETPSGLSFTEFSYQLLQAYDFSVLHKEPWNCTVQLGGSDQMGNISAGIDLIRRRQNTLSSEMHQDAVISAEDVPSPAYGLTLPLLTTSTGAKFGKSAGNAVWLSPDRCSDYEFYQFFLRCTDEEVRLYLQCLTMLSKREREEILRSHDHNKRSRLAQRALATEMVLLVRGQEALERAELATRILYETPIREVKKDEVIRAFGSDLAPSSTKEGEDQGRKKSLIYVETKDAIGVAVGKLAVNIGLVKSRSEATRAMKSGALCINDVQVRDPKQTIRRQDFVTGNRTLALMSLGSKERRIIMIDEISPEQKRLNTEREHKQQDRLKSEQRQDTQAPVDS